MIFLLNGKARSGKDTIADYIISKVSAKKLWFAKPLKDFGIKYFNLTQDECYDHKTELSRRVLQGIGEMFRNEIDKNFWVGQVVKQIAQLKKDGVEHFVISDCRYKNEIIELCTNFDNSKLNKIIDNLSEDDWKNYQLEYYGQAVSNGDVLPDSMFSGDVFMECQTISIKRDNCPQIEYGANHTSENDLNNFVFDWYIKNDGTLEDLYRKVDCILEQLGI